MEKKTVKKEKKNIITNFIKRNKYGLIAAGLALVGGGLAVKRIKDGQGKTEELGQTSSSAPQVVDPGKCRVDSVVDTGFNSIIVVENTTTNSDPECVNAGFYKVTPHSGVDTVCETTSGDQAFNVKPGERVELEYSGRYGLYNRLRRGAERYHGTFAVEGNPNGALKITRG